MDFELLKIVKYAVEQLVELINEGEEYIHSIHIEPDTNNPLTHMVVWASVGMFEPTSYKYAIYINRNAEPYS